MENLLFLTFLRFHLALSWFGFVGVLGILTVLVHVESSNWSSDNLALAPAGGTRSHCVFLKEKMREMKRRISAFFYLNVRSLIGVFCFHNFNTIL